MAKQQTAVDATQSVSEEQGGAFLVDLSGVADEQALPVIPRGVYDAEIDDLTFGHSQAKGNPMWTIRFSLSDSAGEFAGRKLFFHLPFVDNMMSRVKKVVSRLAPELLNGKFNPEEVANSGQLVGKTCKIRVDVRPYEGRMTNNVRDVLPAGGGDNAFLQQ